MHYKHSCPAASMEIPKWVSCPSAAHGQENLMHVKTRDSGLPFIAGQTRKPHHISP